MYRLSATDSLINSHIYGPICSPISSLPLPGLCNCVMDNGCGRLRVGNPLVPVVFDTPYTFLCADITVRYDLALVALNKQTCKQRLLLFMAVKGWIKSTCTRRHIKEIHRNTSKTVNVIDNLLQRF